MGFINNNHIKKFCEGKIIKKIKADDARICFIEFDDGSSLEICSIVKISNNIIYTGGELKISPKILATPIDKDGCTIQTTEIK